MDDIMNKLQDILNDGESMKQIRELADMLGVNTENAADTLPAAPAQPSVDPTALLKLGQVLQSASREDDNIRLLTALRPLLKEESRIKLDRVIKIYRLVNLYPALKESGLGGGELLGIF
ncbi:hypothetical protein [uncultured Ruminococcus sp.]|uniref:hypothetical protein n=1 Tax=uncultured Ruminococcus sp. TaxID=165186 RepID=UPI0025E691A3|nr:hypothetical protein [uncultured Ruminococcus sp.]